MNRGAGSMRRCFQAAVMIGGFAIIAALADCEQSTDPQAPPDPCRDGPDCEDYPDLECPGDFYGCSSGVARYESCAPDCPNRGTVSTGLPRGSGSLGRPFVVAGTLMYGAHAAAAEAGPDASFAGAPDGAPDAADGSANAPGGG
jgi:hypothetical protein